MDTTAHQQGTREKLWLYFEVAVIVLIRNLKRFIKLIEIPFYQVEREKSTGDAWFNMKAPELSQELKGDLQVLKMRGSLDPKRFYKKNDRDGFPKYFQVTKNTIRMLLCFVV